MRSSQRPIPFVAALLTVLVLAVIGACGTSAGSGERSVIRIHDAVMDLPANPTVGAVRLVIDNPTDTDDAVVAVRSPDAESVSIHRSEVDDEGRSMMFEQDRIEVAAQSKVEFEPGGLHVMVEGIERDLEVGDTILLNMDFEVAGTVAVEVQVVEPGTDAAEHGHEALGSATAANDKSGALR